MLGPATARAAFRIKTLPAWPRPRMPWELRPGRPNSAGAGPAIPWPRRTAGRWQKPRRDTSPCPLAAAAAIRWHNALRSAAPGCQPAARQGVRVNVGGIRHADRHHCVARGRPAQWLRQTAARAGRHGPPVGVGLGTDQPACAQLFHPWSCSSRHSVSSCTSMPYKLGRVSREGLKRVHWSPRKSTAAVPPNIANRCSLKTCANEIRRSMQQFFRPTCVARRAAYGGCNYRADA